MPQKGNPDLHRLKVKRDKRNARKAPGGTDALVQQFVQELTAPLTGRQAVGLAKAQAGLEYGPAIRANQTVQHNLQPWFQNYMNRITGPDPSSVLSQYNAGAAPALAQAAQFAQVPQPVAPGLDPNSDAGKRAAQGNQSIQSLGQLGYGTLQAQTEANKGYFQGQATLGAKYLPLAQAQAVREGGDLKQQYGGAVVQNLGQIRTGEQNADIARQTLYGNQANQAFDNKLAVAGLQQTAADRKASRVVSRKNTHDRLTASTDRQAVADRKAQERVAEKQRKDTEKKQAGIHKATGRVKTKIQDIISDWAGGGTVPAGPVDPKTGVAPTRKATRDELRGALSEKHGRMWVQIAVHVRDGVPLTKDEVDYLHAQDPNVRVPPEWRRGRQAKPRGGRQSPTAPGANGQQRPT